MIAATPARGEHPVQKSGEWENAKSQSRRIRGFFGRFRRRARTEPERSARKRGTGSLSVVLSHADLLLHGGKEGGSVGDIDDVFASRAMENFGAFILGRNMFGPVRGPWPDDSWKGWWGDNPPYHAPTFVLTHYEREPIVMEGGTTFYFVTGGNRGSTGSREESCRNERHQDWRRGIDGATVSAGWIESTRFTSCRLPILLGWVKHCSMDWICGDLGIR